MTETEWDGVMQVHLKGTFCPVRHAAAYWRERVKAGEPVDGRIVTTSSGSGLYGNVGQSNYGAAKAGIAAFTRIAAAELSRYQVTVNCIAPGARSRMTESVFPEAMAKPAQGFDRMHADNIAPLVVWLGSSESAGVTGQVFNVAGGMVGIAENWKRGPSVDKSDRWEPAELGAVIEDLLAKGPAPIPVGGT
jgi:NAD(P)-dependent dehydrogenase (short-subunit alcohol dehydrogenase family)